MRTREAFGSPEGVGEPAREREAAPVPQDEAEETGYGALEDSQIDVSLEPAEPGESVGMLRADTRRRVEELRAATQDAPGYADEGPADLFRIHLPGIVRNLRREALQSHDVEEVHGINRRVADVRALLADLPDPAGTDRDMMRLFRQGGKPDRRVADAALLERLEGILAEGEPA